jgi:Protein of unknown function (DUF1761)
MEASKTNWLAVAACVVAGMGLGMTWYGALFQEQWMAGNGITMEGEKFLKNGVEMPMTMTPMIVNTVFMLVYALIMNWLIKKTGATDLMGGLMVGGAVGLMMLMGIITGNMFAAAPSSLSMVDGSYSLVIFLVMGAILGGWQKR